MKRVGIFTKMEMAGGSEFRAVEMAKAISRRTGHQGVLLAEKKIASRIKQAVGKDIEMHEGVFSRPNLAPLYTLDHLLVINTDSRDFTTIDFWQGRSPRHSHPVDLKRIRQMIFLFNFIVSPSIQLPAIRAHVPDVRIITANTKFFNEISEQERYQAVRHYPRMQLESPINAKVGRPKITDPRVRFGMHSLGNSDKWNREFPDLVREVNKSHNDLVKWKFMGMPNKMRTEIREHNVTKHCEFAVPVVKFLAEVDVFVFFPSWKREEAWARSVGEALMSGCPVITTARGGNKNQVIHGNTGFLCTSRDQFLDACRILIDDAQLRSAMQLNAKTFARQFTPEAVTQKFLNFIKC